MRIFADREIAAPKPASLSQFRPTINKPGDEHELQAGRVVQRVMNAPAPAGRPLEALPDSSQTGGSPLPQDVRGFMEPRFGFDFSKVRIHTDRDSILMNRTLGAQAFTHRQDIYYGAGKSPGANSLTAHELAHVVQQAQTPASVPAIQRELEVRPPGRGEGSSFERRDQLINRLNAQSAAIQYKLDGRTIRYDIIDAAKLTHFDRQMQGFIDRAELVPMRLTSGEDRVSTGAPGVFTRLTVDSFRAANVDLDDLLSNDTFSFQSDLIHLLTERFAVQNYARRIGTNISAGEFNVAHQRGLDAEAALYQDLFNDPSIQFNYTEPRAGGVVVFNFTSLTHRYQIFHFITGTNRDVTTGEMFVRTRDGRRVTMEDFRTERAAAPR